MLVCQKLCLNHFEMVTTDFSTQKHVKEGHQEIKAQLKDCRERLKTKLKEVLGLYPDV